MISINEKLQEAYDKQYSDKTEEWRKIGAKGKANNIIEVAGTLQFKKIVEVGAGDGNILLFLSERNFGSELTALEISESAIDQMKKKGIRNLKEIVKFDGYNIPFQDQAFDLAICSHVIEHVEYPRQLIREIGRISKYQIFEIPIDFSFNVDKKYKHYLSYGHINIYTPSLFKFLLKTEGFGVIREKYALYRMDVIKFQLNNKVIPYIKTLLKRLILRSVPIFLRLKPNTYTVLTKISDQKPQISLTHD